MLILIGKLINHLKVFKQAAMLIKTIKINPPRVKKNNNSVTYSIFADVKILFYTV